MTGSSTLILGFITAFLVVLLSTPSLIKVAKLKHLVDEPKEDRKMHGWSIPTIGGIVIFGAILFSYSLWFPEDKYGHLTNILANFKYVIACMVVLFFVGVKDDLIGTAPVKKLIAHGLVGFVLVVMADIRVDNMHGLFGYTLEFNLWQSYLFSFFVYIVIINSINLIDGLDGLASGIGFIAAVSFGLIFFLSGNIPLALLAFVLAGALFGFLVFNFYPARIFMGDSGSLLLGVILCVLAVNFINYEGYHSPYWLQKLNKPVLAMSILVYPLIDTLRVFAIRTIKGKSPLIADKNHIHHRLTNLGMNHASAVGILYFFSILIIVLQFFYQLYLGVENDTIIFFLQLGSAFVLVGFIFLLKKSKNSKK